MDPYSGYSGGGGVGGVGGYPGGGNNNSPYAMTIKIADGVLLFVVAGIFSWSTFVLPPDPWAKVWAVASAVFAVAALLLTLGSAGMPNQNGNWLSTSLHVCLFANCVLWALNFETAAETCAALPIAPVCTGGMRYLFNSVLVASGILQFLYWHVVFDPHNSSAGSGRMPCWPSASCCGPRRPNMGPSGGGSGGNGGNDGFGGQNNYEMGRKSARHSTRSSRRRMADVEALHSGSSSEDGHPHGLASNPDAARYKSLGRRNSRSSRHRSYDSLSALP